MRAAISNSRILDLMAVAAWIRDGIACLVAKTIIDLLEVIQVDIAQG